MITKFLFNAILHHVGMSWIIRPKNGMKYEIEESNNQDWMNKGPWYNTYIMFKVAWKSVWIFLTHKITGSYNLMCYLVADYKKLPAYEDDGSSIGDRIIPKNSTKEVLEALGATINFIDIWLKLLE